MDDESSSAATEEQRRIGEGQVLFTGPDGVGDFRVNVIDPSFVGIGTMSSEGTSDVNYLCRSAPDSSPPPLKGNCVGDVGWGLKNLTDDSLLKTGHQISRGEFRQAVEDRHTHLYQNPWCPSPWEKKDGEENQAPSKTSSTSTVDNQKAP